MIGGFSFEIETEIDTEIEIDTKDEDEDEDEITKWRTKKTLLCLFTHLKLLNAVLQQKTSRSHCATNFTKSLITSTSPSAFIAQPPTPVLNDNKTNQLLNSSPPERIHSLSRERQNRAKKSLLISQEAFYIKIRIRNYFPPSIFAFNAASASFASPNVGLDSSD